MHHLIQVLLSPTIELVFEGVDTIYKLIPKLKITFLSLKYGMINKASDHENNSATSIYLQEQN